MTLQTTTRTNRGLWAGVAVTALIGILITAVQVAEKIAVLKDPATHLVCDVNTVLSCSGVLGSWQSSALGVPNAYVGAVLLGILGSGALGAVLGSTPSKAYLATMWGLSLFFLCFVTWYLEQTAFAIGALCLWCVGCATTVVIVTALLTRIAAREGAFGQGAFGRTMASLSRSGVDLMIWIGWWLVLAAMLWIGLA